MNKFIDREKATKDLTLLLDERTIPWIVLSGDTGIGKTSFAQNVVDMNTGSILCHPGFNTSYACEFVKSMRFSDDISLESVISDFSKRDQFAQSIIKSLGLSYVSALKKSQLAIIMKLCINNDIVSGLYSFAHYLSENVSAEIKCIFLDDFHRCDFDSYCWILEFWNSITESHPTIIAICNFDTIWESKKLQNMLHRVASPINIDRFDSSDAFYDILKENFDFENDFNLANISKQLYKFYDGSSKLLFETIKLLEGQMTILDDEKKVEQILKIAQQIQFGCFDEFSKSHLLVLRLLAYCPNPITKKCIIDMLDLIDPFATDIINKLFNCNVIDEIADRNTGQTLYKIKDDFLSDIIKKGCSSTECLFYKTKIYRFIQKGMIEATLEQKLELAIFLGEENALCLLFQVLNLEDVSLEKKANCIDKLICSMKNVPEQLITIEIIRLLYEYGYYVTAEKLISYFMSIDTHMNYENMLLWGDIQHVLLSPNASQTYKLASEIEEISLSDKLKAVNRQIMALNQEHQEIVSKNLYIQTFEQYESSPCIGLVELYRNSNSSFDYDDAMKYTTKGYFLAKELDEQLEMYKCIHNICMLQLQYGMYGRPLENNSLGFEPSFDQVLSFFSDNPKYSHERAYPLLDLGTAKMFDYINSHNYEDVAEAKKYYSEAQLYAKSFYAQHISETGLLITNSYLYSAQKPSFVKGLRNNLFNHYLYIKCKVEDYRVHRKILLSLALSAIITKEIEEAREYLQMASDYVFGAETVRFNRLCQKAECEMYCKPNVPLNGKNMIYYESEEFVPWLISLCH